MIKTFRGKLANEGQERIRLSTNDGLTGYKIKKFSIFPTAPGSADVECTSMLWKEEQDTVTSEVDFSAPLLLAVAYIAEGSGPDQGPLILDAVVFDNVVFNQDIYVTQKMTATPLGPINYYIELEQVKLDLNEASVATLKDMRGRE